MTLVAKATVTGLVRIEASSGNHDDRATVIAALVDMLDSGGSVLVIGRGDYGPNSIDTAWGDWVDDSMAATS